jgi:hypothetical protein
LKTPDEAELVALIAGVVVGVCIVAIIVLAVREKRRTGAYPCVIGGPNELGWFGLAWILWITGRAYIPESWLNALPLTIVVLGIDLALLVAFAAYGAHALARVYMVDWDRRWGLYIVGSLLFPALSAGFVVFDAKRAAHTPWVWILAVLIAVFLSPFFARFAYEEFYLRKLPREQEPEPAKPRIYRPGERG